VIGVLLSGMLNDGTSGLLAIKRCGGLAVVQDPKEAAFPEMPRHALARVAVDHVRPLAGIGPLLAGLAATPRPPPVPVPEEIRIEALIAAEELFVMPDQHRLGTLSPLTCPECDGSMQEIEEDGLVRYRCHTGHAFTLEALRLAAGEAWERTLYGAMRAQQQQAMVARRMAAAARWQGDERAAAAFEHRARDYEEGAAVIRRLAATGSGAAA
jgi:two-component system chemotaxis response regulator CheB